MLIDDLSKVTLLDGNGNPFDQKVKYFNRYQSTIPHDINITGISVKHKKTIGGFIFDRPVARCKINYSGQKVRGTFESDFIEEGVFGFSQFIPVESGITLKFDYGKSGAYATAVKNLMANAKKENENKQKNLN